MYFGRLLPEQCIFKCEKKILFRSKNTLFGDYICNQQILSKTLNSNMIKYRLR